MIKILRGNDAVININAKDYPIMDVVAVFGYLEYLGVTKVIEPYANDGTSLTFHITASDIKQSGDYFLTLAYKLSSGVVKTSEKFKVFEVVDDILTDIDNQVDVTVGNGGGISAETADKINSAYNVSQANQTAIVSLREGKLDVTVYQRDIANYATSSEVNSAITNLMTDVNSVLATKADRKSVVRERVYVLV